VTSDKFGHPTYETILNTWTQERVNDAHTLLDWFDEIAADEHRLAEAQRKQASKR
jgi:hypothetical protein